MELESIPEQIEPTPEEIEQEQIPELDVEYTTRADYIGCAYYAISSVKGLDTGIMTKEDAKRIKRILRKSLRIIDDCINEMHDELFEDEED
jgi:hypothetical protein